MILIIHKVIKFTTGIYNVTADTSICDSECKFFFQKSDCVCCNVVLALRPAVETSHFTFSIKVVRYFSMEDETCFAPPWGLTEDVGAFWEGKYQGVTGLFFFINLKGY